jgi:hypothetical protein
MPAPEPRDPRIRAQAIPTRNHFAPQMTSGMEFERTPVMQATDDQNQNLQQPSSGKAGWPPPRVAPPGNLQLIPIQWNCSACKIRYSAQLAILQRALRSAICTQLSKFHSYMITYLLTYLRSWALLEELSIVQPLRNSPAFHGTRRFNTVLLTKLCRQQAEVIQNHDNENVRNKGQGEARHRKYKRLKLGGGQAYDRSSVYLDCRCSRGYQNRA